MTLPTRYRSSIEVAAQHGHAPAVRLLEEHREAKARKRVKAGPRRKAKKMDREDQRAETAAIREVVARRAGGKCELCDGADDPRLPLEMHHLLSGRGRRVQQQAPDNCIMVCGMCHAIGHRRILMVGDNLLAWATRHGYGQTWTVIRRRIDKALLLDLSWPRSPDEIARLGPSSHPERTP